MRSSMRHHWVSCAKFTVRVDTDERGIVTGGAPLVRKFKGQPLKNLLAWARGFGGFRYEVL